MANLLRTANSGSDRSHAELHAYNIVVEFQDAATFLWVNPLPRPAVAAELLNNTAANDMVNDANYKTHTLHGFGHGSCLLSLRGIRSARFRHSFAHVVGLCATNPRSRMVRTRVDIPLTICRQECRATTDVCTVNSDDILLLVQEDKRHKEPKNPEPQLIAEVIAAFQTNNYRRMHVLGQDPIAYKVMPGITLKGTPPIFYKVSITAQLAQSVALGIYPATPTVVHAHLPAVARPARHPSEGMKPLDNRATILACYEAFKGFVE